VKLDAAKTAALRKQIGNIPISITVSGLYRLTLNGMSHDFAHLNDAIDFWHFCNRTKGSVYAN
jgi:hypothetical protein